MYSLLVRTLILNCDRWFFFKSIYSLELPLRFHNFWSLKREKTQFNHYVIFWKVELDVKLFLFSNPYQIIEIYSCAIQAIQLFQYHLNFHSQFLFVLFVNYEKVIPSSSFSSFLTKGTSSLCLFCFVLCCCVVFACVVLCLRMKWNESFVWVRAEAGRKPTKLAKTGKKLCINVVPFASWWFTKTTIYFNFVFIFHCTIFHLFSIFHCKIWRYTLAHSVYNVHTLFTSQQYMKSSEKKLCIELLTQ